MQKQDSQIKRLIDFFGGQTETAKAMGVKQPAVSGWLNGSSKISEFNAMKAEKLTNGEIKAVDLCPKLADLTV